MDVLEREQATGREGREDWEISLFHCPSEFYLRKNEHGQYCFRLRLAPDIPVKRVFLRTAPDGHEETYEGYPVEAVAGRQACWWECAVGIRGARLAYRFLIITEWGSRWLNAAGATRIEPTDDLDFKLLLSQQLPSWPLHTVFYQIVVDRFAAGRRCQAPRPEVDGHPAVEKPWGQEPAPEDNWRSFYGGDLWGIADKLPYLKELGINALYLTPIFSAPSSHKYDVTSYTEVDQHLGGEEGLRHLRERLDKEDIRLLLDVIPNHCGRKHPWFQEAISDPQSTTREFFKFYDYPKTYECWLGFDSLPKLNYASQELRKRMYQGQDAVMRKWLRSPFWLDGWRIDVANMLGRLGEEQFGHKVLRGMRRAVKAENREAYLVGEHFFDATSSLQGEELDAVMNYRGFMMPLYHWLIGQSFDSMLNPEGWGDPHPIDCRELCQIWTRYMAKIPWEMALRQLNLLDSHDCPRLLTTLSENAELARVARLLLFTYPGVPSVYYGDEWGLTGGKDPANRQCMPWGEGHEDSALFGEWRQLIQLRRTAPALQTGALQYLLSEGETLAFLREHPQQRFLVVARRSADSVRSLPVAAAAIVEGSRWRNLLNGETSRVQDGRLPIGAELAQLWEELRD